MSAFASLDGADRNEIAVRLPERVYVYFKPVMRFGDVSTNEARLQLTGGFYADRVKPGEQPGRGWRLPYG